MKCPIFVFGSILFWALGVRIDAQIYDTNSNSVQVFAGSGVPAYFEGTGTQAMFFNPSGVVADTSSNLFVLDGGNQRIRKITPDGTTSTFVGGGTANLPGYGPSVLLNIGSAGQMAIDRSGTIWIPVGGGLLRIYSDSYTEYLAFAGDPNAVAFDSADNLYYSAADNRIYRVAATGALTVFAGNGSSGATDANGVFASFSAPRALAIDAANNIYVWDSGNHLIRRIDQSQNVTTIAGDGTPLDADGQGRAARFLSIFAMTVDMNGNVIMACGSSIRKMSASTNVTTIAGSFSQNSFANGVGALARFNRATGVWLSQGLLFVADSNNHRIRQITFNATEQPVAAPNLLLRMFPGLTISGLVGRAYRIESSADASAWRTETILLLTSSPYQWIDQNALGQKKLYRAFLLP